MQQQPHIKVILKLSIFKMIQEDCINLEMEYFIRNESICFITDISY